MASWWKSLATLSLLGALAPTLAPTLALAGGGPRNVLVVVNEASEEALEIANTYIQARHIPEGNICRISTSTALTVDQATYENEIQAPVMQCIASSPSSTRIDYIVLTRGMPIRALFPDPSAPPTQPVSITALLQVMGTTLQGKNQEYGGPTYGFQFYPNPYKNRDEYFSHAKTFGGYRLYIGTMLSGYWSEDGNRLVERSVASDLNPPSSAPGATFYLEDGSGAANVRDVDFPAAVTNLQSRGFQAVHVTAADPNVTGSVMASHVTAGVYSGNLQSEIASNTYPPGAITDCLESFGLTPNNFTPGAGDQAPVTWWVTSGITGAQGTVAEPYNVAFPDGFMLEPYVDGYNLGETYYQGIPYLYWMNLVLGDPLAQPYAVPPTVTITAPPAGGTVSGLANLAAFATTPLPAGIRRMEMFVDDTQVNLSASGSISGSWDSATTSDGWHRVEAIAYENTKYFAQGVARVDIDVDNHGLDIAITSPSPGSQVSALFDVSVTGTASLNGVTVSAEGLDIGSATGPPPWTVSCDSALLGRGIHQLHALGTDAAGNSVRSAPLAVEVLKAPRFYAGPAPNSGPQGGGTVVTIDGWNFEPNMRVFFGPNEATNVTRADANHLQATSPRGAPVVVDVRLVNPLGLELVLPAAFTYLPEVCVDPTDTDADGTCDANDNCPTSANAAQENADGDPVGNACDNCAAVANLDQADADTDLVGDVCDNCPGAANTPQVDGDSDTLGDACDNCAAAANLDQADGDVDLVGDVCDNCVATPNADQLDVDANGIGDVCQGCAATLPVAGLLVTKQSGERVALSWAMPTDPCRALDRVFVLLDPGWPPAPTFPADWSDITATDEDGSATNTAFVVVATGASLYAFTVASEGTNGTLGPP